MWLKQIQLFQLTDSKNYSAEYLTEKLEALAFTPCLASMQDSAGWAPPINEEGAPLVRAINGNVAFCLQIEEKILPAIVIRQELEEAVKQIEAVENRKLRQKEKYDLKDEITFTLLPRAFSKFTKIYAYIDNNNRWLILGTANAKVTEKFMSVFKKSITEEVQAFNLKKLASVMTHWLKTQNYPTAFAIEKACLLQDPNKEGRTVRCQQQDLFAPSILALIKDGCEVSQLALSWQDRIKFVLAKDFIVRGIQFQDELLTQVKELEAETAQQQFDADFLIMHATFADLLKDLLESFADQSSLSENTTEVAQHVEFSALEPSYSQSEVA